MNLIVLFAVYKQTQFQMMIRLIKCWRRQQKKFYFDLLEDEKFYYNE